MYENHWPYRIDVLFPPSAPIESPPTPQPESERSYRCGWGKCAAAGGCPCQAFTGNGNLCGNCGHQYPDHW